MGRHNTHQWLCRTMSLPLNVIWVGKPVWRKKVTRSTAWKDSSPSFFSSLLSSSCLPCCELLLLCQASLPNHPALEHPTMDWNLLTVSWNNSFLHSIVGVGYYALSLTEEKIKIPSLSICHLFPPPLILLLMDIYFIAIFCLVWIVFSVRVGVWMSIGSPQFFYKSIL